MTGSVIRSHVTRRRQRREAPPGAERLVSDVGRILDRFRAAHGWQPGQVWDAHAGAYVWPPQ